MIIFSSGTPLLSNISNFLTASILIRLTTQSPNPCLPMALFFCPNLMFFYSAQMWTENGPCCCTGCLHQKKKKKPLSLDLNKQKQVQWSWVLLLCKFICAKLIKSCEEKSFDLFWSCGAKGLFVCFLWKLLEWFFFSKHKYK